MLRGCLFGVQYLVLFNFVIKNKFDRMPQYRTESRHVADEGVCEGVCVWACVGCRVERGWV